MYMGDIERRVRTCECVRLSTSPMYISYDITLVSFDITLVSFDITLVSFDITLVSFDII